MHPSIIRGFSLAVLFAAAGHLAGAEPVALSSLDLQNLHFEGWKKPRTDTAVTGKPLTIAGQRYAHGIGSSATTTVWLALDGHTERFQAQIGIDDSAPADGSAVFTVIGDGRELWRSPVLRRGSPAIAVDVDVRGVRYLLLKADHVDPLRASLEHGNPHDLVDWIEPRFVTSGAAPTTTPAPPEEKVILTPKPPASPRINGPEVYGCRPGHPFLYRIPTTGERPIVFTADKLPASLQLDPEKGILSGTAPQRGKHVVTLHARNARGEATRALTIQSGDTLALTPPMGWNHWYAHYRRITDAMMRAAADTLVKSGMADVGYAYVNIDDCWSNMPPDPTGKRDATRIGPARDAAGNIVPNRFFPDMAALTAYIHAYGLKAGIYSSPGPLTCAGFTASYQHEEQDARQFAAWGFDFLKYDWCSYQRVGFGDSLEALQKPYRLMGAILSQLPRDIVYNLCQYGRGDVAEWGAAVGGQSWRTADDLGGELNRLFDVALRNTEYRRWSRPGAWNDPDYIQIGYIGDAHTGGLPRPCPLTPTEQYSFMSLWSLMAAPLFYSGDLDRLDEFTVNILCNPEVIAIDQDPKGDSARVVARTASSFILVKELQDGGKAIGLCNRGEIPVTVTVNWSELGVAPDAVLRDVWRQRDAGPAGATYQTSVPRHGVVLFRVGSPAR